MATRWRVGPAASATHLFDAKASGALRLNVKLERCRAVPATFETGMTLEWSDHAYRFHMAAALADRTAEAARPRRRAG